MAFAASIGRANEVNKSVNGKPSKDDLDWDDGMTHNKLFKEYMKFFEPILSCIKGCLHAIFFFF